MKSKTIWNMFGLLICLAMLTGSVVPMAFASLTVDTDKSAYRRGETVTVSVSGGTANGVVMIQFNDPAGAKVWADQDNFGSGGAFQYQLTIPSNWDLGGYTLIVKDLTADVVRTVTFTVIRPPRPPPPPPTKEEIEELSPKDAAEELGKLTPAEAADVMAELSTESAVAILEEMTLETASAIVGALPADSAAEIIVEVDVTVAADILEDIPPEKAGKIVEMAVEKGLTEGIAEIMLEMEEESSAAVLVEVEPIYGADVVESMFDIDVTRCAQRVEAAVELDVERMADILEEVEVDVLADLLLEIARLTSTPSTVAAVFEAMSLDKVLEVVRAWISLEALQESGVIFGYLTSGTLNNVYSSLTVAERATIYPYLSAETVAAIKLEMLPLPDLTPTLISVSKLGVLDYTVTATIENQGNVDAGKFKVELRADASLIDQIEVSSLSADASTTVTFEWKPTDTGIYTLKVTVDPDDVIEEIDETNNELTKSYGVELPDLTVAFKTVPSELVEDETYTIEVEVSNIGEEDAGAFSVALEADGVTIGSVDVRKLAAGSSKALQFSWTPEEAGTYTLKATVDPLDEVVESDETNNTAQVTVTVEKKPVPFPWWIIVVIAVLVVAAILYYVLKIRR